MIFAVACKIFADTCKNNEFASKSCGIYSTTPAKINRSCGIYSTTFWKYCRSCGKNPQFLQYSLINWKFSNEKSFIGTYIQQVTYNQETDKLRNLNIKNKENDYEVMQNKYSRNDKDNEDIYVNATIKIFICEDI